MVFKAMGLGVFRRGMHEARSMTSRALGKVQPVAQNAKEAECGRWMEARWEIRF